MIKTLAALFVGAVLLLLLSQLRSTADHDAAARDVAARQAEPSGDRLSAPSNAALAGPEASARAARRELDGPRPAAATAPPALLTGRVVDDLGAPRSRVGLTYEIRGRALSTESGPDGTFRIALPRIDAPRSRLSVDGPSTTMRRNLAFSIDEEAPFSQPDTTPGALTDVGDILVRDACILRGRVVGPEGEPVAGARISAHGNRSIVSDVNGSFQGGHVGPTNDEVQVSCPRYLDARLSIEPVPGGVVDLGVIELAAAPRVRGRVLDSSGQPIPTARVRSDPWNRMHEVAVDPDGAFEAHVATLEGPTLTASAPGYRDPYFSVPVRPGQDDVVIRLESAGVLCRVRVIDAEAGSPVEFSHLAIDRVGVEHRGAKPLPQLAFEPTSESRFEGGWITLHADPGKTVIDVAAHGYASTAVVIEERAAEEGQVIGLQRPRALVGQVFEGGEALEGAEVILASGPLGAVEPEREGIDAVEPLAGHDLLPALRSQDGFAKMEVRMAEPRAASAAPAVGLFADVRWAISCRSVRSGPDGRFAFPDIQPGGHQVFVRSPDGEHAFRTRVFFADGTGRDLGRIELLEAGSIRGRIRTRDGMNLSGHRVRVHQPIGEKIFTDGDGRFRIDGVPAGGLFVHIETKSDVVNRHRATAHYLEVLPGEVCDAVLTLDARSAARLEVEVTLDGAPMEGVHLSLQEDGQQVSGAVLDGAGRATLTGPAYAPLQLETGIIGQPRFRIGDRQSYPATLTEMSFELKSATASVLLPGDLELFPDSQILLHWTDSEGRAQIPLPGSLGEVGRPAASFGPLLDGARLNAVVHVRGPEADEAREIERWETSAEVAAGERLELVLD